MFPSFSNTRKLVTVVLLLGAFQISKAAPVGDDLNNSPVDAVSGTAEIVVHPVGHEVVLRFHQDVETSNKTKEYVELLQLAKSSPFTAELERDGKAISKQRAIRY